MAREYNQGQGAGLPVAKAEATELRLHRVHMGWRRHFGKLRFMIYVNKRRYDS